MAFRSDWKSADQLQADIDAGSIPPAHHLIIDLWRRVEELQAHIVELERQVREKNQNQNRTLPGAPCGGLRSTSTMKLAIRTRTSGLPRLPAIDHLQGVGQFDCGSNPYWKTGERGRIFPKWRQLSDVTIAAPSTIALTRSSWCRTLVTHPVRSAVTR